MGTKQYRKTQKWLKKKATRKTNLYPLIFHIKTLKQRFKFNYLSKNMTSEGSVSSQRKFCKDKIQTKANL